MWLISFLGLFPNGSSSVDVLVTRSTNGVTWSNPVAVNTVGHFNDKNWTVCDNTPTSPFFGNCYTEFDDNTLGDLIQMSTSRDGGLSWGPKVNLRELGQDQGASGRAAGFWKSVIRHTRSWASTMSPLAVFTHSII